MNQYDAIIVGAGIFGLTIAERLVNCLNKKVLLIEKRPHIGGNCFSIIDPDTKIECHKYGAHIFHTSNEEVWKYVNKFSEFTNYQHRVYTTHKGEVYPLPINLGTINQFFHACYSPDEAKRLLQKQASIIQAQPNNLKDKGISLIGQPLFEAFFMNYTSKQWQTPAEQLPPQIITRLPVRYNYNNRYFSDTYEGLPISGYYIFFQKMLDSCKKNLTLKLNTDYFADDEAKKLTNEGVLTIFTGPIDQFFKYKYGHLKWRTVEFKKAVIQTNDFQGCSVMNYADLKQPYTRIIEFKHFHPERNNDSYNPNSKKTIIFKEFSKTWQPGDEPYYPVRTRKDVTTYHKYQKESAKHPNIIFGGRLGEYAYYDMDATFARALQTFQNTVTPHFKN